MQTKVLVTGANGFVGRRLCEHLLASGYQVRAAVRNAPVTRAFHSNLQFVSTGDLIAFDDWQTLLQDVGAVVHLVARTHVTDEFGDAALPAYRALNVDVTRRLAYACARRGVGHFVLMSSIKAVGNGSNEVYRETTPCRPEDSYGISKLEAEHCVEEILNPTSCQWTVLRPPLIYGTGVQGNFLRLLKLVQRGVPLPAITNARSMAHVDNVVDATMHCLRHPTNAIYHVADPDPVSTADLMRYMSKGLGRSPLLVPVPKALLAGIGSATGWHEEMKRLVGSLTVSPQKLVQELQWQPKVRTADGVIMTAGAYASRPWDDEAVRIDQHEWQRAA